jgi:hypothetical protein
MDQAGPPDARPLLVTVMEQGQCLLREPLGTARERARHQFARLPPSCLALRAPTSVPVRFSAQLQQLQAEVASRTKQPSRGATALRDGSLSKPRGET